MSLCTYCHAPLAREMQAGFDLSPLFMGAPVMADRGVAPHAFTGCVRSFLPAARNRPRRRDSLVRPAAYHDNLQAARSAADDEIVAIQHTFHDFGQRSLERSGDRLAPGYAPVEPGEKGGGSRG